MSYQTKFKQGDKVSLLVAASAVASGAVGIVKEVYPSVRSNQNVEEYGVEFDSGTPAATILYFHVSELAPVPAVSAPRKLSFRRERDDVGGGYGRSDY